MIILFLLNLPGWLQVSLSMIVLTSLYRIVMRHALRRDKDAVTALRLTSNGEILLRTHAGDSWFSATIESRFVHRRLVLLLTRCSGRRFSDAVVVPADALNYDTFRRLRAMLLAPPRTQGV